MESSSADFIKPEQFMNKILRRNGWVGEAASEIMAVAINAVNPYQLVSQYVKKTGSTLIVGDEVINLQSIDRIYVIGFGKASVPMARALLDLLHENVEAAEIVTKSAQFQEADGYQKKLKVHLGSHPIPSEESIQATRRVMKNFGKLTSKDLVFVLISGGGSALFTDPVPGVSLEDLMEMTKLLLRCGADIQEINTLRKHLDLVKGGRLARRLDPAQVHTLILSDVVGDRLDMIASGPTVPDPTTYEDALVIVRKYDLRQSMPESILAILEKGRQGEIEETLKAGDFQKLNVWNYLVGSNIKAAEAALKKGQELGFNSMILTSHLVGKTCDVADFLMSIIHSEMAYDHPLRKPACIICGGETTVDVRGDGLGGRNQDLVLHMVKRIADTTGILFISLGTDGEDGPTDAAGAASDAMVYRDGKAVLRSNIETYLDTNNAYNYFKSLGGLIKTGSTGTNVNDLILILLAQPPGP